MTVNIEAEVSVDLDFDYKKIAKRVIEHILDSQGFPYESEVSLLITDNLRLCPITFIRADQKI